MPHAPLGILDIPRVAGNDVNMDVVDTLPGRRPDIHPDVVAVGAELFIEELFFLINQVHASCHLFGRQVEEAGDMALRLG